jgi:hypothetical protein
MALSAAWRTRSAAEGVSAVAELVYNPNSFIMEGAGLGRVRFVKHGDEYYRVEFAAKSHVTRVQRRCSDGSYEELWNRRLPLTDATVRSVVYFVESRLEDER